MNNADRYDDMIQMPHHRSEVHPHMSLYDRVAQFSPFAALTGHGAVLTETERMTDAWIEPDENVKEELDRRLQRIQERLAEHPTVSVTYFEPDDRKEGGAYVTTEGEVKGIDQYNRTVVFNDGRTLDIDKIIECNIIQSAKDI